MTILTDFRVTHNLSSDAEAETILRDLITVIDEQKTIDQILEDEWNWDKIKKYKTHDYKTFLDLENVEDGYNHFIEGDVIGMPDSTVLRQTDSGYMLVLSHRGDNERTGEKYFEFDHNLTLITRVERFEKGVLPEGLSDDAVVISLEGDEIVSAESYNSMSNEPEKTEPKNTVVNKSEALSGWKSENAYLLRLGYLIPSATFMENCRSKFGEGVNDDDVSNIIEREGLNLEDVDFSLSKAYVKDGMLHISKATTDDWKSIVNLISSFTQVEIEDKELLGVRQPSLYTKLKRKIRPNSITREYPLGGNNIENKPESRRRSNINGISLDGSIHQIINSEKTFDDIGGQDAAKELASSLVNEMKERKALVRLGLKDFTFIIGMYGPPGTGKTLLAEIIAHESSKKGRPLLAIAAGSLDEQLVGVGSGRIRSMFEHARKVNGIIFIDEMDSVGMPRSSSLNSESSKTLNTLLTEIEGIKGTEVDVIWATNVPFDQLDRALLSRTGYKITMNNPNYAGRKEIFEIHARAKRLEYSAIAALDHFARFLEIDGSGRIIKNMLNTAVKVANRSGERRISDNSLQTAFETTLLGIDGSSNRELQDMVMKYTAFHEAGHAVTAYFLIEKADDAFEDYVNMISIKPSGSAAGFVLKRGLDWQKEQFTRRNYVDTLAFYLAGHVSESINFSGEVTPGASSDFNAVRNESKQLILAGIDGKVYMDDSSEEFMAARNALVEKAYKRAEEVLKKHQDKVSELAQVLMEEKVVYRDRFLEVMEGS